GRTGVALAVKIGEPAFKRYLKSRLAHAPMQQIPEIMRRIMRDKPVDIFAAKHLEPGRFMQWTFDRVMQNMRIELSDILLQRKYGLRGPLFRHEARPPFQAAILLLF